ncbi:hypothetical protein PENTCL1PPCAC_10392, partial [Pristionchus entomophagus]
RLIFSTLRPPNCSPIHRPYCSSECYSRACLPSSGRQRWRGARRHLTIVVIWQCSVRSSHLLQERGGCSPLGASPRRVDECTHLTDGRDSPICFTEMLKERSMVGQEI